VLEFCGDGVVNQGAEIEQCDDANTDETDGCTSGCVATTACLDVNEPNDDATTATLIDTAVTGALGLADADWYQIEIPFLCGFSATLTSPSGVLPNLSLLDLHSSPLASGVGSGTTVVLTYTEGFVTGTAFLVVEFPSAKGGLSECVDYDLAWACGT
jgi:cysteine-rich repeat protein